MANPLNCSVAILIGVGIGISLARHYYALETPTEEPVTPNQGAQVQEAPTEFPTTPLTSTKSAEPAPAYQLLNITIYRQAGVVDRATVLFVTDSFLIMPLHLLDSAIKLELPTFSEKPLAVEDVRVDVNKELALLRIRQKTRSEAKGDSFGQGLPDATLTLGRDFFARSALGDYAGAITGQATTFNNGSFGFPLPHLELRPNELAILVDAYENTLIGIAINNIDAYKQAQAYGWHEIVQGFRQAAGNDAYTWPDFRKRFFKQTLTGRLVKLNNAYRSGEYASVLRHGQELWSQTTGSRREDIRRKYSAALEKQVQQRVREKNYAEALNLISGSTDLIGTSTAMNHLHATLLFKLNRFDEAYRVIERALAHDPDDKKLGKLHYDIFFARFDQNRGNAGLRLERLRRAIKLDPYQADFFVSRAEIYATQGQHDLALQDFYHAIDLAPALSDELASAIKQEKAYLHPESPIKIPITRRGGVISIPVFIDGLALRFVIDTGASVTTISQQTAARLGIPLRNRPRTSVATANGTIQAAKVVIRELSLGNISRNNVDAIVLDGLNGYDGLLGLNFFDGFGLDLDPRARSLTLTPAY